MVRIIAVGFQLYQLTAIRPRTVFGQVAALPDFTVAYFADYDRVRPVHQGSVDCALYRGIT